MNQKTGGPYLSAALFCEKTLKETDGVLSAIRMIDRFNFRGKSAQMDPQVISCIALIVMKSGSYRGRAEISIQPFKPSGKEMPRVVFPVNFEGDDDRGVGIAAPLRLGIDEEGTYWFDVKFESQLITRMPIRIQYHPAPSTESGSSR